MASHTVKNKAAVRNSGFLATAFKKSLYIRTALALVLLIVSLFTADKAGLTIVLRILSVIISACDIVYAAVVSVTESKLLNTPLIYVTVVMVSMLTGNSSEGAMLCIIYQLGQILAAFVSKRAERRAVGTIKDAESRETVSKVLEYRSAPELDIKEGIEKTFFPLLLGMILIGLLYLIALPVFGHLNIILAVKRSLVIILLAEPAILCSSFRILGVKGICLAACKGTVLNCVKGLNDSTGEYVISSQNENTPGYISVRPAAMERDSFINFAVHLLAKSQHKFAKFIIKYYNFDCDPELIRDFKDVEGGSTGSINGMPVYFGTYEMLSEYGIAVDNPVSGRYYMYLSDRYVGSMEIEYPESEGTDLSGLGRRVDILAVENSSLTFTVKAILLIPAFTGFCSISVAAIIGIVVSVLAVLNTNRLYKEPSSFDMLFSRYFKTGETAE